MNLWYHILVMQERMEKVMECVKENKGPNTIKRGGMTSELRQQISNQEIKFCSCC